MAGGGVSGVPGEFADFYRSEHPRVLGGLIGFCGDPELAEECAQEAFARAAARWERVRKMHAPGGWLYVVALNAARSVLRRRRSETAAVLRLQARTPVASPPVEPFGDSELRVAIQGLPRSQQVAVGLFYVFDLPVAEVASAMDVPENTVKSYLHRARTTLRGRLTPVDGQEAVDVT